MADKGYITPKHLEHIVRTLKSRQQAYVANSNGTYEKAENDLFVSGFNTGLRDAIRCINSLIAADAVMRTGEDHAD